MTLMAEGNVTDKGSHRSGNVKPGKVKFSHFCRKTNKICLPWGHTEAGLTLKIGKTLVMASSWETKLQQFYSKQDSQPWVNPCMARHNCRGKLDGRQSAQVSSRQGQVFQASKQQGGLEQEEGEDPKGLPPPFSLKENVDRIRCKNRFISPQNTKEIELNISAIIGDQCRAYRQAITYGCSAGQCKGPHVPTTT